MLYTFLGYLISSSNAAETIHFLNSLARLFNYIHNYVFLISSLLNAYVST